MDVKIAVLGCGNVGSSLVRNIISLRQSIYERYGINLILKKVLVKSDKRRDGIPEEILTKDFQDVVRADPDIVVELIGGEEPAREFIKTFLKRGKKVVTANKHLLAKDDEILFNENVFFDGAVGGGIPIIRTISQSIQGKVEKILGILNGTTNFILSSMEEKMNFHQALKLAQKLGYAESDPSLDIEGQDAAEKISILSTLCFGVRPKIDEIYKEGISFVREDDIDFANEMGYRIKPIALSCLEDGGVKIAVYPAMVPKKSLISLVSQNLNAVYIKSQSLGWIFLKGQGAGGEPTSISILSDIIQSATGKNIKIQKKEIQLKPLDNAYSIFYVRLYVVDKPGVLGKISTIFGNFGVSISTVLQKGRGEGVRKKVPIFITTHQVREKNFKSAIKEIEKLNIVLEKPIFIRIEKAETDELIKKFGKDGK